jgi:hypothetical protein
MPARTCPNCLSGVSIWVTKCPFCKADLPAAETPVIAGIPPMAPAPRSVDSVRKNSTLKALVVSYLVLQVGGGIGVGILMIRSMVPLVKRGVARDEMVALLMADNGLWGRIIVFTVLATILGGFVAGWLARERETYHSAILGLLSLLVGAASALPYPHLIPVWPMVISGVVTLPSALFGGYLARLLREHREDANSAAVATPLEPPLPRPGDPVIAVKSLWRDRLGHYIYVPLVLNLGCYAVPADEAAAFDQDVHRFRLFMAIAGIVFIALQGLDPVKLLYATTIAASMLCIGLLWRSRNLVPIRVAPSDIIQGRFGRRPG